jgi:hypothetical protein
MEVTAVSVYEKLKALNISLPEVTQPVAAFVPFVRSGKLLFVSGHIAKIDGKPWVGQLGRELSTEQGPWQSICLEPYMVRWVISKKFGGS